MVTKKISKSIAIIVGTYPEPHTLHLFDKKNNVQKKRRKGKKERLIKNSLFYIANFEDT